MSFSNRLMISKHAGLAELQLLFTHSTGGGIPNWAPLPIHLGSADAKAAFTRFTNRWRREHAAPFIKANRDFFVSVSMAKPTDNKQDEASH